MQDALPIVIVAVVAVGAVFAVLALARGKGVYDHIRAGDRAARPDPPEAREAEIAQMVAARDARRAARGPAPGGVPVDDDLRAEVRALVVARNARRVARGERPIDVDSEVERRLRELDG